MSAYKLTSEIIARSTAKMWDVAKLEWTLHEVFESDEPETCLCGHYPIIENCVLHNKTNGRYATVGNCCVKKFMGLPSDLIFQASKRVRADSAKSLNAEAVSYAHARGWVSNWERDFYFSIMRKRVLSERQSKKKRQINESFLRRMNQSTNRPQPQFS